MTFVGSVEMNGSASLYAMSPDHYPLVLFSHGDQNGLPAIDAPPGTEAYPDLPDDIDSVTRARKERATCGSMEGRSSVKCLVGMKPVVISSTSRYQRLLDAVPSSYYEDNNDSRNDYPNMQEPVPPTPEAPRIPDVLAIGPAEQTGGSFVTTGPGKEVLSGAALGFALLLIAVWYLAKKQSRIAKSSIPPSTLR